MPRHDPTLVDEVADQLRQVRCHERDEIAYYLREVAKNLAVRRDETPWWKWGQMIALHACTQMLRYVADRISERHRKEGL